MKTISLWQPWAYLVVAGIKTIETRSWKTDYRGRMAIHATKKHTDEGREFAYRIRRYVDFPTALSYGAIVGMVTLTGIGTTDSIEPEIITLERLCGDYSPGRYGWALSNPVMFKMPIPYKGRQGFFEVPDELIERAKG